MSRNNGPVKGTITLSCPTTAESSTYICEPILISTAQLASLEAGTMEVSGTLTVDGLGHSYFPFAVSTVGSPTVTGVRQVGSTKGLLVFTDNTDAITPSYIVEPVTLSSSDYAAVLAGTKHLQATMFTDGLGHTFFQAEAK